MEKFLSIVLLDDISFAEMTQKLEKSFDIELPSENKKGRYIGQAETEKYKISLIDRKDDLGDFLSDDYHTLDIEIEVDDFFDYHSIEKEIKDRLKKGGVNWESGIWSKANSDEDFREIFPDRN